MRSIYLSIVSVFIWLLTAVNVNAQTAVALNWNFTAGTGACATTPPTGLTAGSFTIGNSFGTVATPISTSTGSTGYTGASGTYNIGNASRIGILKLDTSAYIQVVITPDAANYFTFSGISFGTRSTSTGPQAYTVRTSLDNYATDVASSTITNNSTWALKSNTFSTAVVGAAGVVFTIRIYGYNGTGNASSGTINWKIDDINISGTLTPANTPLLSTTPSSLAFGSKCINQNYVDSFVINALSLTSANVDIAALAGYSYASSLSGPFTSTLSLPQSGGVFTQKIYTQFSPTVAIAYNGAVAISGGGLSSPTNVNFTGSGISTAPSVTTVAASFVTSSDATLNASGLTAGCGTISNYHFEYSTTQNFTPGSGTVVAGANLSSGAFSVALSSLQPSTTYYYVAAATNSNGVTTIGTKLSFTTLGLAPTLTASSLTAFGNQCTNTPSAYQSINLSGSNLTNANVQVGPASGFEFSATSNGTYTDSLVITQSGGTLAQTVYMVFKPTTATSYSANIPVLGGGATSSYVVASGTGITTLPTLSTATPVTIAYNGATINGNITAMNCGGISSYGIEYGTDPTLSTGTNLVASTNLSSNAYSSVITGLIANTIYYFRAYAVTVNGTANSSILSFTTSQIPFPNNLNASNVTSNSFVANWDAVIGAANYRLDVSESSTFTNNPATIVGWGMSVAASKLADTAIAINTGDSLITFGGTNTPTYNVTGSIGTARADAWQSGNGVKGWEVNFATTGYHNIRVSSKQRSSSSGPKNFKLQYRVGNTGAYTDVTGGAVVTADNYTTGVLSNLALPAGCEDQPLVYLRWIMSSNTAVNNTAVASTGASNIDNISIAGGQYFFLNGYQNKLENGLNDTITGLSPNTTYYLRVRTEAPTSTSTNSPVVAVTTSCVTPVFSGTPTNVLCGGTNTGSISLTNSGTGTFSYSWTGPNLFTATSKDINNLEAGTYYVTVTSAACSASDSFVITSSPILSANATISSSDVCSGTTVNLDATATGGTGSYTYFWVGANGFFATTANANFVADSLSAGFYSVAVTDSNGCTANGMALLASVTPSATPVATVSSTATTICAGTSVSFTSSTSGGGATPTYQWMLNGSAITGETNDTYSSSQLNNGDVVSLDFTTSETCYTLLTATSNTVTMTVNPNVTPLVTVAASANPICPGSSVSFTSLEEGGGTTPSYQWYLNSTPINGETNTTFTSLTLSNNDVVSLTMATSAACASSATVASNNITMIVGAMLSPSVSITASANTVCSGNSVNFTSTVTNGGTAPTYQWYVNGNSISGATNDSYSTSVINNGDVFTLEITSNAACLITSTALSNAETIAVFVAQGTSTASGPLALCSGGNVTLTAGNGSGYLWSNGATTQAITVNTAGSYSVTYNDVNGCNTSVPAKNVLSKTLPTLLKIKALSATTVCDPNTIKFTVDPNASSVYGFDFQWNLNGTAITGATDTSYTASGASGGNITLTIAGSTCTKTSAAKAYTIKPLPVAAFTAGGPTTFCAGGSVTLTAPTITGYTYTWLKDGLNAGSGNFKVFKLSGNYTVIAKLNSCADTANVPMTITVNPLPIASISTLDPTTFCTGDSATLDAAPVGTGFNYQWINGTISTYSSVSSYEAKVTGTYKVMVTDNNGCVSKASVTNVKIKMNTIPVGTITAVGSTTISATGNVKLNASPSTGVTWQWYKDGNAITGATTKQYIATAGGDYTVAVTKLGCIGTSAATTVIQTGVKEETGIVSDNSFQLSAYPNPVNDVLTVTISGTSDNTDSKLEVMNALGQLVVAKEFSSNNIQLSTANWANGIYLVRYKDNTGRTGTLKITKE